LTARKKAGQSALQSHNTEDKMDLHPAIQRHNELVQTLKNERQRMAKFIEKLEVIYASRDRQEPARACRIIIDHLRSI